MEAASSGPGVALNHAIVAARGGPANVNRRREMGSVQVHVNVQGEKKPEVKQSCVWGGG